MNEEQSSDSASVSSESKSNDVSSTTDTNHTGTGRSQTSHSSFSLARAETQAVRRSKRIVLLVILLAAIAIGTATYLFMRNEENDQFEAQFTDYAIEVGHLVNEEMRSVFAATEGLSTAVTSHSLQSNETFPFLTIPHFEIRGTKNLILSRALQYTYAPLIKQSQKAEWESYVAQEKDWLDESIAWQNEVESASNEMQSRRYLEEGSSAITEYVWIGSVETKVEQAGPGIEFSHADYAPIWQQSPAPKDGGLINFDLLSDIHISKIFSELYYTKLPVLSQVMDLTWLYGSAVTYNHSHPQSLLMLPIFDSCDASTHEADDIGALLLAAMPWDAYFQDLLTSGINGIILVLENSCNEAFTYQLNGPEAVYLGAGDLHDTEYDHLEYFQLFSGYEKRNATASDGQETCEYDLRIYPSDELQDYYLTNAPAIYACVIVLVFFCTAVSFLFYDYLVQVRQNKVMNTAKRTNAIVSSLFPENVRDRILKDAEEQAKGDLDPGNSKGFRGLAAPKSQLKDFLGEEEYDEVHVFATKPIADLFPQTTVLFADIVGFTAWSSVREPTQVFTLLETLYHAFDEIAKQRRVFKVETIGDCYVAVTGLPDPRKDHAVVMARFARDCLHRMNDLVKKLEVTLGPDTADLSMRFGLHSGPVTAGVLRGDKSRFQLFGDTVNTAARIESTGERNRIHLSKDTADLLIDAGKTHWVEERKNTVQAKGKGELQTFWLQIKKASGKSTTSRSSAGDDKSQASDRDDDDDVQLKTTARNDLSAIIPVSHKSADEEKVQRLVEWNSDVLCRLLKQVVARRQANASFSCCSDESTLAEEAEAVPGRNVLDEVVEIVHLPDYDAVAAKKQVDISQVELDPEVVKEMRDYVSIVAAMYRRNPFHNFEHASHVTMSVVKLLSRIVVPDIMESDDNNSTLHDHTYGITSDPLTQFAVVFSALIHDVDHFGVPNAQLVKEQAHIATFYNGKSVAEQNSVDISWDLLMDSSFSKLRRCIFGNIEEQRRFRQLVVNTVMATDIMDKDLKVLRNDRWAKAFSEETVDLVAKDSIDRKATIVIEHLIQASDVAHTMQHWHVYRKWNERFFEECYKAYKEGRAETDPSEVWYKGEMGFYDFYIIPLAKKLKDCGVFGVSSDEYLAYAEKNRREWEEKGMEVVQNMVEKFRNKYADTTSYVNLVTL